MTMTTEGRSHLEKSLPIVTLSAKNLKLTVLRVTLLLGQF
jgi:hypothetical protein